MFSKAITKLTARYLGVLVIICLFFSIPIYELSVHELDRGIRGPGPAFRVMSDDGMSVLEDWLQQRDNQYEDSKHRILRRLVVFNTVILVGGGFVSYFLAKKSLEPIERAHENMSRFTADASHELRTPITAMRTENEVTLLDPKLNLSQAKAQIRSNIEELENLTKLSEELLRLSSLEAGELGKEKVSAVSVVDDAVNRLEPIAKKRDVSIKKKIPKGLSIFVDESSIKDAIVILLDNAIKYSPKKSTVNIEVRKSRSYTTITVADKGMGIEEDDLPHIFDRFYRADTSRTKSNINGHGLGLSIAQNIATLHGGEITVKSKPGKGSAFTIRIPG